MKSLSRLEYRIQNFSPAWFATLMGVGQTAAVLHNFPFQAHWLRVFGIVIWGIALVMFLVFNVFFVLRFVKYPGQLKRMFMHPGQSMFLGCYPMGFATIINMIHFIWGHKAWKPVYVLWWIDSILSLASCWGLVFLMASKHSRSTEAINATILLPVVPLVVASATGGLIAPAQPLGLQPSTLFVSFLMWGNGISVALSCICIYLWRLIVHNLPPRLMAFSSMLPIGPLGQGSFGIICMAEALEGVLKARGTPEGAVEAVKYGGVCVALFLVGYGTFWLVFCISLTIYQKPTTFHMSWWGLTFPLGTYVVAWYKLAEILSIVAFRAIGAVFGVLLVLLVAFCSVASIYYGVVKDNLFDHARDETNPLDQMDDLPNDDDDNNTAHENDTHTCSDAPSDATKERDTEQV